MSDRPPLPTTAERLADEFEGVFSLNTIEEVLADSLDQLQATAKVHKFVQLIAERFTRERLRAIAESRRPSQKAEPDVLFVCVHNAGRSQMAAALLDQRSNGRVRVHSAGSAPATEINPAVVTAMAEIGIDVHKEFPKPLTTDVVQAADVVVTMGCGDACPIYPGKRYLDWELPDPAGRDLNEVRAIRDLIDLRVQSLLSDLTKAESRT